MTNPREHEGSGRPESAARVAAGFAVAVIGILVGLAMAGLGLVALMFAIAEPSSATVRLTAVGLAAIVLGIASVVAGVRVRDWIMAARDREPL